MFGKEASSELRLYGTIYIQYPMGYNIYLIAPVQYLLDQHEWFAKHSEH